MSATEVETTERWLPLTRALADAHTVVADERGVVSQACDRVVPIRLRPSVMRIRLERVVGRGLLIGLAKLPLSVLMLLSNEPVVVLRSTAPSAKGREDHLEVNGGDVCGLTVGRL